MKIFDLHLDLEVYLRMPEFLGMKFSSLKKQDLKRHGDIPQFKSSELKFAITNIFPFELKNGNWFPLTFKEFIRVYKKYINYIEKFHHFKIVLNLKDFLKVYHEKGKIGIILGVEGLNFLRDKKDAKKIFDLGIRIFGLNWNIDSIFSTSLKTKNKIGLTKNGIKLIKFLEEYNVALDLAHSSIYTIKDTFKIYNKPVIFSHNGVKKKVRFEQNLSMFIIKKIKNKNCLLGLTLLPYSLTKDERNLSINDFIKQYQLIRKIIPKNIAVGTDFFGFKFRDNFKEARNYLEFYNSLKKINIDENFTFYNAFQFFKNIL